MSINIKGGNLHSLVFLGKQFFVLNKFNVLPKQFLLNIVRYLKNILFIWERHCSKTKGEAGLGVNLVYLESENLVTMDTW